MPQMNSFTIGLRATMNVGNYENINPQAQATFTPLDGETIEEAAAKAVQQVHAIFAEAARDLIQTADVGDRRRHELLLRVGVTPEIPLIDPTPQVVPANPDADSSGNGIPDWIADTDDDFVDDEDDEE